MVRRVDSLADRRALTGDRISALSDRMAGMEHRQTDVYRALDRLADAVNSVEVRLSGMEATVNAILAILQGGES